MSRVRKNTPGRILFVGSGPGDPALLTVHARDVLAAATLAFTDPDVDKGVTVLVGTDLASTPRPVSRSPRSVPHWGSRRRSRRPSSTRRGTATTSCVWCPATR